MSIEHNHQNPGAARIACSAIGFTRRERSAQVAEKIVVDTLPLNLINFKAYKHIDFQGMRMSSGREGA